MVSGKSEDIAQRRRAELLETTEKLIVVHGYDAVKLRDVAAEADVSIGLIQHYFTTRDELVRAAMTAASQRRIGVWSQTAKNAETEWQRLHSLLGESVSDPERCAVWLELCAASTHHPELRNDVENVQHQWRALLRKTIQAGHTNGEFAPVVSPNALADILVNIIDGKMLDIATSAGEHALSQWLCTTIVLARRLLGLDHDSRIKSVMSRKLR